MAQPKSDQSPLIATMPLQLPTAPKKTSLLDVATLQKLTAVKETSNVRPAEESIAEEESFSLNKKKVKLEGNNAGKPQEAAPVMLPMNIGYTQIIANPNMQESSMMHPALANTMIDQNQQSFQILPNNQAILVPVNQNTQQGMQMGYPNISFMQQFPQNVKVNPISLDQAAQVMYPVNTNNQDKAAANIEEMMKETQKALVEMLAAQNKMLINLKEKNELVQDTLACLINEVNSLKQTIKQNSQEKTLTSMLPSHFIENPREVSTSEALLHTLYGSNQDFPYQLMFKNEFQLPLYRERNFRFTVLLTDKDGNQIKNANKIPLTLAIYTSENPPKYVEVNTSGNKILKGMIDKDLVNGSVTFEKIQVKEVTSHFRNGWVFFVVYPKIAANGFASSSNAISAQMVKPLIVEKVVVKAKRAKLNTSQLLEAGALEVEMDIEDDADNGENPKSSEEEVQEIFTEEAVEESPVKA